MAGNTTSSPRSLREAFHRVSALGRTGKWLNFTLALCAMTVAGMMIADRIRARRAEAEEVREAQMRVEMEVLLSRTAVGPSASVPSIVAALGKMRALESSATALPVVREWQDSLMAMLLDRCRTGNPNLEPPGDLVHACRVVADDGIPRMRSEASVLLGRFVPFLLESARKQVSATSTLDEWASGLDLAREWSRYLARDDAAPLVAWADTIAQALARIGRHQGDPSINVDTLLAGWARGWNLLPALGTRSRGDTLVIHVDNSNEWYFALQQYRDRENLLRGSGWRAIALRDPSGLTLIPPAGQAEPGPR